MEDNGNYRLQFMNPTTLKRSASGELRCNMAAWEVRNAVRGYWLDNGFGDVSVERQRWTAAGAETESNDDTAYVTYDILLRKHIEG